MHEVPQAFAQKPIAVLFFVSFSVFSTQSRSISLLIIRFFCVEN